MKRILIVVCAFMILGCGMKIMYIPMSPQQPPKPSSYPIQIFELNEDIPQKYKIIGKVSIGEAGMTMNCGYDDVIFAAQDKARNVGGDAIQIIQLKVPDYLSSTCYTLVANVIIYDILNRN